MEKKELKMYEAPAAEIVEVEAQGVICASDADDGTNADGIGSDSPTFGW